MRVRRERPATAARHGVGLPAGWWQRVMCARLSEASNSIQLPTRRTMSPRREARCVQRAVTARLGRSWRAGKRSAPLRAAGPPAPAGDRQAPHEAGESKEARARASCLVRRSGDSHGRAAVLMRGRRRIGRRFVGDGAPGRFMSDRRGSAPSRIAGATSKVTMSLRIGLPSPLQTMSFFGRLLACKPRAAKLDGERSLQGLPSACLGAGADGEGHGRPGPAGPRPPAAARPSACRSCGSAR